MNGDADAQEQTFPHYQAAQLQALEVVLEPGDGAFLAQSTCSACAGTEAFLIFLASVDLPRLG